jgi:succinate-semialdehyde dehydrogenase/glutarate-semialdehyde dehydrogenase
MTYQSINPFDGKLDKTFPTLTSTELEQSIATAEKCFAAWRMTSFAERSEMMVRAATILRARVDEFARPVTLEMGKLMSESRGEVLLSADILAYYATHAEGFLAMQPLTTSHGEAELHFTPLGVLFGVQPWNFPYYQLARFAAPNLMAGNVVMVKHASCVPACAHAFEALFREAGAPVGAYTNLTISYEQANAVIDDARICGAALTGSVDAGRGVAARAGQNLKKSTMELGGNDAFIVLNDAELERTVHWAVWAKMNNMGQCCVAAKRFIVEDGIYETFLSKFKEALVGLKPGDPMLSDTTLGPLSTEGALVKLVGQVNVAVARGAKVLLGGARMDRPGAFMQPTILSNITPDNPAFDEEFFGPIAVFFRVQNEDEAVALANHSSFGLGASVFTQDVARGKRLAARIESGMVFVNHPTWTAADLPFGGIKTSGYGRELSELGVLEFVNKKLVRVSGIDDPA